MAFVKESTVQLGPRTTIVHGDIIKVKGMRGRYKFLALIHPSDGRRKAYVDCIRVDAKNRQHSGGVRSVYLDRIRRGR